MAESATWSSCLTTGVSGRKTCARVHACSTLRQVIQVVQAIPWPLLHNLSAWDGVEVEDLWINHELPLSVWPSIVFYSIQNKYLILSGQKGWQAGYRDMWRRIAYEDNTSTKEDSACGSCLHPRTRMSWVQGGDTVCALIFAGLNIHSFHGSAAICENLDIVWKGAAGQVDDVMDINMATISSTWLAHDWFLCSFVTKRFVLAGEEACLLVLTWFPRPMALGFVASPSMAVAVQKKLEGTTHAP